MDSIILGVEIFVSEIAESNGKEKKWKETQEENGKGWKTA